MSFQSENETVVNLWDFKAKMDYVDKWLLMESPIPLLVIWVSYLLFVLKFGPDYMKKRPAFNLTTLLIVYNIVQVVYSIYLVVFGLRLLKPVKYIYLLCTHDEETMRMVTRTMHLYFLAKLSELVDTIFFVLRKKQNQVTFLHVYHHSVLVLSVWMALKFEPSFSTVFLGTVNSFVHAIMYAYYGLSAFPSITKYLWWKKYITRLQLAQFVMIFTHALGNYMFSECQSSRILLYAIATNQLFLLILFSNFYIKSYKKEK